MKDFDTGKWIFFKPWRVLGSHPKWSHNFDREKACDIIAGTSRKKGNQKEGKRAQGENEVIVHEVAANKLEVSSQV